MRELFASDNFNFQEFLASQSGTPLEESILSLEKVSKTVQNELYELINGDLVHFKNVLKEVCDIDIEAVKQFRHEFEAEKVITEENYLHFKEYFDEINRKFQRFKYIQKKKETMIRLSKARQYIEVFRQRQVKSEHSIYELEINVKNYIWLLSFCSELSGELVESESTSDIHRELSRYSESLQEILEIQLKRTLGSGLNKSPELLLLIRLCKELNKMNLFEASFKMTIVYPSIEKIIQESSGNFESFLQNSFCFIKELRTKVNVLQLKNDFMTKTILAPIIYWITEKFSTVFIPSNLAEFKSNFEKGLKFVSEIENEFFEYEDELVLFRNQPAWINFMKKWALHQYYQTITKETILNIENCLRHQAIAVTVDASVVFEPTLVVIESLKQLWKESVILKPLIPKFLKLTIQIFRRFIHFCTEAEPFVYENPKIFVISSLQKQFNLKHFMQETEIKEQLKKYLDPLDDQENGSNMTCQIFDQLKLECEESLKKSRAALIPGVEGLYDQLLFKREDVKNLQLDALKLLKEEIQNSGSDSVPEDPEIIKTILQQILLKFNRTIFKLIDEKRLKARDEILQKMKEIEGEAKELGYENLANEEFWLEIKAAI